MRKALGRTRRAQELRQASPLTTVLPEPVRQDILAQVNELRKGVVLTSPCKQFHLQLIEPPQGADDIVWNEGLIRIALGTPDVLALTRALQAQGVAFVDAGAVKPSPQGALSHTYLGSVMVELVHHNPSFAEA